MNKIIYALAALPTLTLPTLAAAQDAEPVTPDSEAATLQEIVVTAQKRSENLQKVPISVVAKTGEQLTNAGIVNTMQINTLAPGLNVRSTVGAFQPYIRGIGTSSSIVENPVALYIDGIYMPQQREGMVEFNDVEQISVLKGPQGTLFGRNATAGVIQITTKGPKHTLGAEINLSYGNYQTAHADAFITGPLSDTVAFSLEGSNTTQGKGWGTNRVTGADTNKLDHQYSFRGKLLIEPTSDTSILLAGDYMNRFQHAFSYVPYPGTQFFYVGKTAADGTPITMPRLHSVYDTGAPYDSTLGTHGGGGSLTITQKLGFAELKSITAYRKTIGSYDFDNAGVVPELQFTVAPNQPSKSFSEELQLVSDTSGPISWTAGVYYFYYNDAALGLLRYRLGVVNPAGGFFITPTSNYNVGRQVTDSLAPFAQADWKLADDTTVTVGLRYNYEKRKFTGSFNPATSVTSPVAGAPIPPQSLTAKKLTYRVALRHDFTQQLSAYASFNTGFKSGGFNIIAPAGVGAAIAAGQPTYFLPEKLTAYEVGVKSQLLGNRLRLNAAAFYYDYTNIQALQITPAGQIILNGAGAHLYGLDADVQARMTSRLRITAGVELLHAEFTSFPNAPTNINPTANNATLASLAFCTANPKVCDAAGKTLPLAQNVSGNLGLDYDVELTSGNLHFNTTGSYNGRYFFEPDNYLRQPAYVMLNSSLKWTSSNGTLSLTAWGRNLLDKHIITYSTSQTNYGYTTTYGSAPRTYGFTAGLKF